MIGSATTTGLPRPATADWGHAPPVYPWRDRLALIGLVVVPALLVGIVLGFLVGSWLVTLVLIAAWGLKCFVDARVADPIQLRRVGARALGLEEQPRLRNITRGLASDLKVAPPRLYLIEEGGPNAFVRGAGREGIVALTRSLLESYTRTELEATVAHCLVRIHSEHFVFANLAARWSDLGAGIGPRVDASTDVRAAAVTRYPPALADALRKADPQVRRYVPLWMVAKGPSHQPTADRIAVVADL